MNKAWVIIRPNSILNSEDGTFYISYNSGLLDIPIFRGDGDPGETAIVSEGKFYILNGDHRHEYEGLIDKGLDACLAYFEDNQHLKSSRSN